jgi:hypothetical protein
MKAPKRLRIILSFDHELPLGGVHKSFDDAVFTPTYRLMELGKKINVPVSLFTDIQSALFFKRNNIPGFYDKYAEQLQTAVKTGNDVQLHIHPHWLKATYSNNEFHPHGFFNLSDFKDGAYPENIEGIVESSIVGIESICKQSKPDFKCIAYRAGGYNLAPETKRILEALVANGIKIESSIVKGFYHKSGVTLVNYDNMPDKCNWYISPEGELNKPAKAGLLEVPVASRPAGLYTNVQHIVRKKMHKNRAYVTGKTIYAGTVNMMDKLKSVFSVRMLGFDVYTLTGKDLMKILDHSLSADNSDDIILSAVSHPKNMGPYSISLMEDFVARARDKYPNIEFVTYADVAKGL